MVARADPFTLLAKENKRTCERKYSGPTQVIYDKVVHKVCPVDSTDLPGAPLFLGDPFHCDYWSQKKDTAWKQISCKNDSFVSLTNFIQVKEHSKKRYVYCPTFNITYLNRTFDCPNEVFSIPDNIDVSIGPLKYPTFSRTITSRIELGPSHLYAINTRLMPNLKHFDLHELPTDLDDFLTHPRLDRMNFYLYVMTATLTFVIVAILIRTTLFCAEKCACQTEYAKARQLEDVEMERLPLKH